MPFSALGTDHPHEAASVEPDRLADRDLADKILTLVHGRDREILRLWSDGSTLKDVAATLGRDESTIYERFHAVVEHLRLWSERKGWLA